MRSGASTNGEDSREYLFFLSEPIPLAQPYTALTDYLPGSYADLERLPAATVDRISAHFGSLDASCDVACSTPRPAGRSST